MFLKKDVFFTEVSLQTVKIYEHMAIIIQIGTQPNSIALELVAPWYLIMVPNMEKIHPAVIAEYAMTDGSTD